MAKKLIASIFPMERYEYRGRLSPQKEYRLPAVLRGQPPALLVIEDQTTPDYIGNNVTQRSTITAEEIAPDLVTVWTNLQYTEGDAKPAIWVVDIPGNDNPTVEEIVASHQYKQVLASQNKFFDLRVKHGDRLAAENKRDELLPIHRVACDWLGLKRDWNEDYRSENLKTCQFCGKNVYVAAMKCEHCGEVIDYERYAAEIAAKDNAVRKATSIKPPLNPTEPKKQAA